MKWLLFLGLVEVTLPSWGIGYMSVLEGRGGAVRAKLHLSKSDLRTGLHDSDAEWGAGVPDYFEKMNKGGHLTPGRTCPLAL